MFQRLLLALALASAPILVHAHAPAADSAEVHGKKPGFFKRLFHRHKDAPQWDGVQPELRSTLERIALQMKGEGYDLRLMEGYRSEQRQAALLASQTGVTQVGPGSSCHNHGWAADMVIYKRGRPSWDLRDEQVRQGYQRFGELAQQAGLRWGGAWKSFQDMPHVEMRSECLVAIRSYRAGQPMLVAEVVPEPVVPLAPMWPGLMPLAITPATPCEGWMCARRWDWNLSVASAPMGGLVGVQSTRSEASFQCPASDIFLGRHSA